MLWLFSNFSCVRLLHTNNSYAMRKPKKIAVGQPNPKEGTEPIGKLVLKDMQDRIDMGFIKYGTVLKAHNGRDPLLDAYEEVIDLAMYLRQEIYERYGE